MYIRKTIFLHYNPIYTHLNFQFRQEEASLIIIENKRILCMWSEGQS
jgi:hypothetical protein